MSDLGGGRTSNGGPVPVPAAATAATPLNKPTDVLRNRRAREARQQEEKRQEEQRRKQQQEEDARRRSAERRTTGAATGGEQPRYSQASSQYTPDVSAQQGAFSRLSGSGQVASGADYGVPTGRGANDPAYARRSTTGTSQAQDQPRPAPPVASAQPTARRPQPAQPRQPNTAEAQPQSSNAAKPEPTTSGPRASTFPHAFERWEQLSSHWEGLTSYWLRRLETDAEEITRTVPSAAAMSRQINDLSAAGANLFHAVVELQRLRASSERKFQRWFFETRADTERNSEIRAQLEQQLAGERAERQRVAKERVDVDIATENARREVAEARRELMISKQEARRAWEELGRRNQESLELAESLKAGKVTIVSGVQVMPIFGQPSRTASASQRPATREGIPQQYEATAGMMQAGAAGLRSPGDDEYYDRESPTNTDPFIESHPPLHHEPGVPTLATGGYQQGYHATAGSSQQQQYGNVNQQSPSANQQATPRASQQQQFPSISADSPERYYQQAPQAAEYRRRHDSDLQSESEDWEAEDDPVRQQQLAEQYGLGGTAHPTALTQIPPEAPSVPATSAAAMATYGPPISVVPQAPDYEGGGFDDWEGLGGRSIHHPTRLSDVPEEEERSSRRTQD